jgi:hypothetical protein
MLVRRKPSEIWLIQNKKLNRRRAVGGCADAYELASNLLVSRDLEFVETINTLLDQGILIDNRYRHIKVHRIIMEHDLDELSKLDRSPSFIRPLMSHGRERGKQFLEKRKRELSRRSSTCLMT